MDERATWRSPELGEERVLELPQGGVRCFERGSGPAIVLVHGLLVNANLWRKVVPLLAGDFRCIALDLPFGSHTLAMPPDADLSGPGLAGILLDALATLELEASTLVGNDSGGAVSQQALARDPGRIGRLALTSCDAFEHYPPPKFAWLVATARLPAPVMKGIFMPMRWRAPRRLPIAFGWLAKRAIDADAEDSYVLPALTDRQILHDARKATAGFGKRHTLAAAERFGEFDRPVLIAWSRDDRVFPPKDAERLAHAFPNSRLEWIEDSYTFSAEDQPARLAELLAGFAA